MSFRAYYFLILVFIGEVQFPFAFAQTSQPKIDFSRYIGQDVIPHIDPRSYVAIPIEWTISGKEQALLNSGITALADGDYGQAVETLRELTAIDPKLFPANYYLAVSLRSSFMFAEAEHVFRTCTEVSNTSWQSYLELANTLQLLGRWHEARKGYEYAIVLNSQAAEAYFYLGHAELATSQQKNYLPPKELDAVFARATKFYQKSTQLNPQFAPGYVMEGLLRSRKDNEKQINIVESLFAKALKADSTSKEALFWCAIYYSQQGEAFQALKNWNSLILHHPREPRFYYLRSFLNIELERYGEAFADIRKAVLSFTPNEERYLGSGTILDRQIDLRSATEYAIRNSYGLAPEALDHFKKGFCLLVQGNYAQASEELEKAKSLDAAPVVFFTLGLTYEYAQNHEQAYLHYHWALERDKDIFDAYKKRAVYRSRWKDWRGAMSDYNEMLRLNPKSVQTYRLRARTKATGKDWFGAIHDLGECIKRDSTDAGVFLERAYCYDKVQQPGAAALDYVRVVKLNPTHQGSYDMAVQYCLKQRDSVRALELQRLKAEQFPNEPMVLFELIELQALLKHTAQAKSNLERFELYLRSSNTSSDEYWVETKMIEGILLYADGDYSRAAKLFSRILDRHPLKWKANSYRTKCHIALGTAKADLAPPADSDDREFFQLFPDPEQNRE